MESNIERNKDIKFYELGRDLLNLITQELEDSGYISELSDFDSVFNVLQEREGIWNILEKIRKLGNKYIRRIHYDIFYYFYYSSLSWSSLFFRLFIFSNGLEF